MSDTDDKLVHFQTFLNPQEAEIVRGLLETQSIQCYIENAHANSAMWHLQHALGGVRIMVLQSDLKQAERIFNEHTPEQNSQGEPMLPKTNEGLFRAFISLVVTLFTGAPTPLKKRKK